MPTKRKATEDPVAALEIDEFGHIPPDTDPLVAAEWYATHGREAEGVLALIRHANGGDTPGEAARKSNTDTDTEGADGG